MATIDRKYLEKLKEKYSIQQLGYETLTTSSSSTNPYIYYTPPNYTKPISKMIKFFRINQLVEMPEGAKVTEKLDELRIKVAKWLNKGHLQ